MTADLLNPEQRELLQAAFDLGVAVLDQDGHIVVDPALVAELRLNRRLEGRDLVTGALPAHDPAACRDCNPNATGSGPTHEIVETWCVNDEYNAVGVVDGESYCASCYPFAVASSVDEYPAIAR